MYGALAALPVVDDVLPTSRPQAHREANNERLARIEDAILVFRKRVRLASKLAYCLLKILGETMHLLLLHKPNGELGLSGI